MNNDSIAGGIERPCPTRLEGWCWSPTRPGSRLTVEILLDDVPAATTVAGLFRRDLAQARIGDGRHAFVVHVSDRPDFNQTHLDAAGMICLREQQSGRVVARIRQRGPAQTHAEDARLDGLRAGLAPIDRAASAPSRPASGAYLRALFGALGDRLAARADSGLADHGPDDPIAQAVQRLARTVEPLHLPIAGAPETSIVLIADADIAQTRRVIAALAPSLATTRAELLVVDDGTNAETTLLGTVIRNMTLVRAGAGFAAAGNAAALVARGGRLLFLDSAAGSPAPGSLTGLRVTERNHVVVGAASTGAASRYGLFDLLVSGELAGVDDSALLLGIDQALFRDLGGLDPLLAGDAALCALDLGLKAALLGHRVDAPAAPWPRHGPPPGPATEMFRRRWPCPAAMQLHGAA